MAQFCSKSFGMSATSSICWQRILTRATWLRVTSERQGLERKCMYIIIFEHISDQNIGSLKQKKISLKFIKYWIFKTFPGQLSKRRLRPCACQGSICSLFFFSFFLLHLLVQPLLPSRSNLVDISDSDERISKIRFFKRNLFSFYNAITVYGFPLVLGVPGPSKIRISARRKIICVHVYEQYITCHYRLHRMASKRNSFNSNYQPFIFE